MWHVALEAFNGERRMSKSQVSASTWFDQVTPGGQCTSCCGELTCNLHPPPPALEATVVVANSRVAAILGLMLLPGAACGSACTSMLELVLPVLGRTCMTAAAAAPPASFNDS